MCFKNHYQLVQGCNNVIIVRKIITIIITMIFFDYNALSKANFRKAVTSRMPEVREAKLRAKMSTRVLLNFCHLSSAKTFPSRPVRQCGRKFPRKLLLSVPVTDDSRKTCVFRKLIFHPLSPCASRLSKNCYRMFFC